MPPACPIIDDDTPIDFTHTKDFGRGLIPRNFETHPQGYLAVAPPAEIELVPENDVLGIVRELKATGQRLSDIRRKSGPNGGIIPSLNQGQWGYCWGHSTTMGRMMLNAIMGQPYVKYSAFQVCATLKNYKNEGGWGALSLEEVYKNGQTTDALWPEGRVDRSLDTPAMRADAAKRKVTGVWADVNAAVYDRNMTLRQVIALLLKYRRPVVGDFNWWGHSVILLDVEEVESGSLGIRGLNSWGDEWGEQGEFVLRGSKMTPDGAVAPMTAMAI